MLRRNNRNLSRIDTSTGHLWHLPRSGVIAGWDHNIALRCFLLRQIILQLVRMELLHLARHGILPAQLHTGTVSG